MGEVVLESEGDEETGEDEAVSELLSAPAFPKPLENIPITRDSFSIATRETSASARGVSLTVAATTAASDESETGEAELGDAANPAESPLQSADSAPSTDDLLNPLTSPPPHIRVVAPSAGASSGAGSGPAGGSGSATAATALASKATSTNDDMRQSVSLNYLRRATPASSQGSEAGNTPVPSLPSAAPPAGAVVDARAKPSLAGAQALPIPIAKSGVLGEAAGGDAVSSSGAGTRSKLASSVASKLRRTLEPAGAGGHLPDSGSSPAPSAAAPTTQSAHKDAPSFASETAELQRLLESARIAAEAEAEAAAAALHNSHAASALTLTAESGLTPAAAAMYATPALVVSLESAAAALQQRCADGGLDASMKARLRQLAATLAHLASDNE